MVFGGKKIFKNKNGEIHVGLGSPEGFGEGTINDVKKALKNPGKMKLWRCHVCDDLHIGIIPPETCPTCLAVDAFAETNEAEIKNLMEIK